MFKRYYFLKKSQKQYSSLIFFLLQSGVLINAYVWNNGIFMQIKRTISRNQCSEIDDFINRLLTDDINDDNSWVQPHVNNSHVQRYFTNLHKHISSRNLHHLKGYESLIDGLYILLKGQIKFMLDQSTLQKSKLKKLKSSKSSPNSNGVIISQPWSVFQCIYKNCTATTESYVLRITEEQAAQSNFYQLYSIRRELYSNRYLAQDHHKFYDIPEVEKPFYASLRIHSHFSFRHFYFRELLFLSTPAIILNGRAKLKITNSFSRQFDKYGVLLPNLKYQVSTSEISLMIIENNQTLNYDFQLQFDRIFKIKQCNFINSIQKTEICTPKYSQDTQNQKEMKRKHKQQSKIFKQSQQYSIISTFLCEKSLNFAKKHNIIHHTKQKKQNRCKSPLILFDIVAENSKISTPKFQSIHSITPNQSNTKYFSAHKVSSQSECNQSNLLKKIKLSPSHHNKLMKKHPKMLFKKSEQDDTKPRRVFNVTLDKIEP